jgi:hypothetical protein
VVQQRANATRDGQAEQDGEDLPRNLRRVLGWPSHNGGGRRRRTLRVLVNEYLAHRRPHASTGSGTLQARNGFNGTAVVRRAVTSENPFAPPASLGRTIKAAHDRIGETLGRSWGLCVSSQSGTCRAAATHRVAPGMAAKCHRTATGLASACARRAGSGEGSGRDLSSSGRAPPAPLEAAGGIHTISRHTFRGQPEGDHRMECAQPNAECGVCVVWVLGSRWSLNSR